MPRPILLVLCAGTLLSSLAQAQCPNATWTGHFATPASGLSAQSAAAALHVFDPDGAGPAGPRLYVGGSFATAGNIASPCIASWNGSQWASVGGGVSRAAGFPLVTGIGTHDPDGAGPLPPLLIAAGRFDHAGSVPVQNIAAWDGAAWAPLGSLGVTFGVGAMTFVHFDPDGPGPAPESLYVAGSEGFSVPTSSFGNLARWDGAQWSAVENAPARIFDLAVFDEDGAGPALPALFAASGLFPGLHKWDGATWSVVGGGLRSGNHTSDALLVVDEDGPGPLPTVLLVGGYFTLAGTTPVTYLARWDGQSWSNAGQGIPWQVEDIIVVDSTSGAGAPTLFATTLADGVFRRDPGAASWTRIGSSNGQAGLTILCSLIAFDDDGPGPLPAAIYYTSPSMTLINSSPSYGIARYGCTPCYPNCDGSVLAPALNVNDFICFLNRFAAADPYANCDSSTVPPVHNVNDFTCFLNRCGAGCP